MTGDIAEPVVLFLLPEDRPLAVRVASLVVDANVLAVSAHLFDGHFQPIASTGFSRFTQRDDGYALSTFVNADMISPAYLLLRPDKAWHDREVELVTGQRWSTVWIAPTVMGTYSDGTERIERLTFSDAGDITLRAEPYRRGEVQPTGR